VGDRAQLGDRGFHREVGAQEPVLDHREHQRGRAQLEIAGDLAHVRVADDHVQAAVLLRVGVRLVPGVDDRPLQRRLQADLDLEEVRALPKKLAQTRLGLADHHVDPDLIRITLGDLTPTVACGRIPAVRRAAHLPSDTALKDRMCN
jgi:hypothetical protein